MPAQLHGRYDPGFRRALLDRTSDLLSLNASEISEIASRLDLPLLRDLDSLEIVRQIHTNVEVGALPAWRRGFDHSPPSPT